MKGAPPCRFYQPTAPRPQHKGDPDSDDESIMRKGGDSDDDAESVGSGFTSIAPEKPLYSMLPPASTPAPRSPAPKAPSVALIDKPKSSENPHVSEKINEAASTR